MEQHLSSTFYSGARNAILRSESWFIKKECFDIRRSLLCRHSSFSPLLGEEGLLDEPKDCLPRGLRQRFNRSFFINHHSHLKMTTSPVKLCLLPTPTPSALRSRLYVSIKGVSWDFKTRWTSVYFPLLPAPTGTNVFHFDMISSPISNVAPLSGLPMRFPWRGCAHLLLTTFDAGSHATNN